MTIPPAESGTPDLVLTVAGVRYVVVSTRTFEHDLHIMEIVRACGLDKPLAATGRPDEEVAADILIRTFKAGRTFDLLAALLVPDGEPWTPTHAAVLARQFALLTDDTDKRVLQEALGGIIGSFFVSGESFSATSATSLPLATSDDRDEASPAPTTSGDVEPSTSQNGTTLSVPSPDTIPTG